MISTQLSFKDMIGLMKPEFGYCIKKYSAENLYRVTTKGDNRIIPSQHFTVFKINSIYSPEMEIYKSEDDRKIYIQSLLNPSNSSTNKKLTEIMDSLKERLGKHGKELLELLDYRYNDQKDHVEYKDFHLVVAMELPFMTPILLMNYGPSDQVYIGSLSEAYSLPCNLRDEEEDDNDPWSFVRENPTQEEFDDTIFIKSLKKKMYEIGKIHVVRRDSKNFFDMVEVDHIIRSGVNNEIEEAFDSQTDCGYNFVWLTRITKRYTYDRLSRVYKEIIDINDNEYFTSIAVEPYEVIASGEINYGNFEGYHKMVVGNFVFSSQAMTIAALSDNISEKFVDMVREQVRTFKDEIKYVIANILLSGYNYVEKRFIVDIPDPDTFDNIELFIAKESNCLLTSEVNDKILRPKQEKDGNSRYVVLFRPCDDDLKADYWPSYIPLFKIDMVDRLTGYAADESYNARVIISIQKGIAQMFAGRIMTIGGYKGSVDSKVSEAVMVNNDNLYITGSLTSDECITRWRVIDRTGGGLYYGHIRALDIGPQPVIPKTAIYTEKDNEED